MTRLPARRLLLVHAHPDDESITNGATMAKYAAQGAQVTLVTCTLGEEGEVIPAELAHLAADRDDTLGAYRRGELAAAMEQLRVTDHRILGGAGRYRDSGMMGAAQNRDPRCFWQADPDDAALDLVRVVRQVRPQVLVTYDPDGGYGHPDHIRAHQVAMRAVALAADAKYHPDLGPVHTVARVYWTCVPRSFAEAAVDRLRHTGTGGAGPADSPPDRQAGAFSGKVTVDASACGGAARVAGRAVPVGVTPDDGGDRAARPGAQRGDSHPAEGRYAEGGNSDMTSGRAPSEGQGRDATRDGRTIGGQPATSTPTAGARPEAAGRHLPPTVLAAPPAAPRATASPAKPDRPGPPGGPARTDGHGTEPPSALAARHGSCPDRSGDTSGPVARRFAPIDHIPGLVDDSEVTTVIDGTEYAERKAAAMRAHATQITVDGWGFALSNDLWQPLLAHEHYRLALGEQGPDAVNDDLFAGLGV